MNSVQQDRNFLLRFWDILLATGIRAEDSRVTVKKYLNLNKVATYDIIASLLAFALALANSRDDGMLFRCLLFLLVGPIILLASNFRFITLARILACYLPILIFFVLPIITSDIVLSDFFWYPTVILFASFVSILVFDPVEEPKWIIVIIISFGLGASFIDLLMVEGLREPVNLSVVYDNYYFYKVPQLFMWALFSILFFRQFRKSNLLMSRTENSASLLQEKNQQISHQGKELASQNEELQVIQHELVLEKDQLNRLNAKLSANEEVLKKAYLKLKDNREEIESQNTLIINQNKELLQKQKEISDLNLNLEKLVDERTKELEAKNKALLEYAHFNSHQVRAPLARIMGLLYLLKAEDLNSTNEMGDFMEKLDDSVMELDSVIRHINDLFEKENKSSE